MVRIVEPQLTGCLTDVVAVHQQVLGLVDDVRMDMVDGRTARRLSDEVAKIVGRVGQLRSTEGHRWQTFVQLSALAEILVEQGMKLLQDVGSVLVFVRKLP